MNTTLTNNDAALNNYCLSNESIDWEVRGQMFSTEKMFARLKERARNKGQTQILHALDFASAAHEGQRRKKQFFSDVRQEYISHPLLIACQMEALGLDDEELIVTALLHDVCEDCGYEPNELPFSSSVRHSVDLLTKKKDPRLSKEENNRIYYARIREDRAACVVKIVDRCNNVSTMAQIFSASKLSEYIGETEEYVLPLIKFVKHSWPEYSDLAFVIKYHVLAVLETAKTMLLQEQALYRLAVNVENNNLDV